MTLVEQTAPRATKEDSFRWTPRERATRLLGLITTYVSMWKTYVDVTPKQLSDRFGKESTEFRSFLNDTHTEYDRSIGYRLTYHLRNALLHTGTLPLTYAARLGDNGESIVQVLLDRDRLLNSYDWKSVIREDIGAQDARIDLMPILSDGWHSLSTIEENRSRREITEIADDAQWLHDFLNDRGIRTDEIALLSECITESTNRLSFDWNPLPTPSILSAIFTHDGGDTMATIRERWHEVRYGSRTALPEAEPLSSFEPERTEADRLYGDAARLLSLWETEGTEAASDAAVNLVNQGADAAYLLVTQFINISTLTSHLYELVTGNPVGDLLNHIQARGSAAGNGVR